MASRSTATLLLALLLAATLPAVPASWSVHGDTEPNSAFDSTSFMWRDADTSPAAGKPRIYFNVVGNFNSTGVNPNSEVTGSRVQAFPNENPGAYLGAWKDCDKDGYIGMGAGALTEYRAELLLDASVCPAGSMFNDGEWVYEFIWIHPGEERFQPTNRATKAHRVIEDPEAYVWGDVGAPGGNALDLQPCDVFQSEVTRPVTMPFHGATTSTGVLLKYADCWIGHQVARTTQLDPTGLLFIEDPERPEESSSVLNQELPVSLFGYDRPDGTHRDGVWDEEGGEASVTVWDCSQPEGTGGVAPAVNPQVNDPAGNLYAAVVEFERGVTTPPHPGGLPPVASPRAPPEGHESCSDFQAPLADSAALPVSYVDGPPARDVETLARRYNEWVFQYLHHQTNPLHIARNNTGEALYPLGEDAPASGGTDAARFSSAIVGPGWFGGPRTTRLILLERTTLAPAGPLYETYYARLGANALSAGTTPGSVGFYGSDWCGASSSGIVNQFDCDPSHWWNLDFDPNSRENPRVDGDDLPDGQVPGAAYHLRDVDCKDNTLAAAAPVSLSSAGDHGVCVPFGG